MKKMAGWACVLALCAALSGPALADEGASAPGFFEALWGTIQEIILGTEDPAALPASELGELIPPGG